jgi:hypothetical protein
MPNAFQLQGLSCDTSALLSAGLWIILTKPTLAPCFLFELLFRSLKIYSGGMKQAMPIIHTFTVTDCNAIRSGEAQIAVCISQVDLECMCTVGDEVC